MPQWPGAYCLCGHHCLAHREDAPTLCDDPRCLCEHYQLDHVLKSDGTIESAQQIQARSSQPEQVN
jgi:hypothetical protein